MEQFIIENPWIIWLVILWILPWMGVALWKAARNNHKKWFIALLVINSMAILEILYIFVFSKKKPSTSIHPPATSSTQVSEANAVSQMKTRFSSNTPKQQK